MGRYRSRSRSYSPRRSRSKSRSRSPLRRKRYDDTRDRHRGERSSRFYGDRRSSAPSGLLVRNVALDARPEDLRIPFERFGPVKDVYLPKNYYTGEPWGFGFVKFRNTEDAAEAKQQMNHQVILGREITIVFAEENRKTPTEMRSTARIRDKVYSTRADCSEPRSRSLSPPDYDDRDYRSHRRSLSPHENGNFSRSRSYSPRS